LHNNTEKEKGMKRLLLVVALVSFCSCRAPNKNDPVFVPYRKTAISKIPRALYRKADNYNGWSLTGYRKTTITVEVDLPIIGMTPISIAPAMPKEKSEPAVLFAKDDRGEGGSTLEQEIESIIEPDPALTKMFEELKKARTVGSRKLKQPRVVCITTLKIGFTSAYEIETWEDYHDNYGNMGGVFGISYEKRF